MNGKYVNDGSRNAKSQRNSDDNEQQRQWQPYESTVPSLRCWSGKISDGPLGLLTLLRGNCTVQLGRRSAVAVNASLNKVRCLQVDIHADLPFTPPVQWEGKEAQALVDKAGKLFSTAPTTDGVER